MKNYYHPLLQLKGADAVPHILGLTASPVIRSKPTDLEIIERNLNALCRTPRVHRGELLEYVHPPTFVRLAYLSNPSVNGMYTSSALVSLVAVHSNAINLSTPQAYYSIDLIKKEAKTQRELKSFCTKASHIYDELGQWAADYYIKTSIEIWSTAEMKRRADIFSENGNDNDVLLELLLDQVQRMHSSLNSTYPDETNTTRKVRQLVRFLTSYREGDLHGIIFVEQRATVAVLHQLLSLHPMTKGMIRGGTFIGTSSFSSRKSSLGDWLSPLEQTDTLDCFRKKDKNFIIATSVLEEGIDISACNIVICFNRPPNLKSFIQRRGRARKSRSIFVLLVPSEDRSLGPQEWGDMEDQMREEYQKDASMRQKLQQLEDDEEHVEGYSNARFEIKSTGALLTLETAVAHIHHFCATLPPQPYVDLLPKFYFQESSYGLITGVVTLPNCVDSSVRTAASCREWKSERMAKKDAAFQAYVALYKKGLVNENLLPLLLRKDEEVMADIETRASLEEVSEIFNPWTSIAKCWMEPGNFLRKKLISIARPGLPTLYLVIVLPQELPGIEPFTIYWDNQITYSISITDTTPSSTADDPFISIMRQVTSTIFQAIFCNRMPAGRDDFLALFIPHISVELLQSWLEESAGNVPVTEIIKTKQNAPYGLIRDQARYAAPHLFKGTADDGTIEVVRLPKRRDFLHRSFAVKSDTENEADASEKPVVFLPLESSTIDKLPMEFVECSLLIPSIMHRLWRQALALNLYNTVFEDQGFLNLDYVITATNAPSANEDSNYQRLEFIGDSVLKYLVCVNLYAIHPLWPEGYLSRAKDQAVANSRLSRAALAVGLDRYIVTKTFTARKWSPPYIQEILEAASSPEKRTLSTKVLADVVEALIGGAFLDRGFEAAATCISRFLPEMPITAPRDIFARGVDTATAFPPTSLASRHLSDVEGLIGYQFTNRGYLLEAITHPSCEHDTNTSSYQRLEFIGDATLDMIVVSFMVDNAPHLSHGNMHLTKTAVVNAGFLAYLCMDASLEQVVTDVSLSPDHYSTSFTEVRNSKLVHLCQLMRHQHPEINTVMSSCLERYQKLQPAIASAIDHGKEYPWVLLTSLAPAKFLSDIVESIIGAVLIDSGGDLAACKKVAEHLGLIAYLRRILDQDIDILHPKNKLGEMSGGRTVEYKLGKEGQEYTCKVEVGGAAIITVSNGISQEEVMTRAAYMAAELLG
ncbi:Dicer-like protein 2 [Pseudogymnoascus australis]